LSVILDESFNTGDCVSSGIVDALLVGSNHRDNHGVRSAARSGGEAKGD